jgi:hypothetical protein
MRNVRASETPAPTKPSTDRPGTGGSDPPRPTRPLGPQHAISSEAALASARVRSAATSPIVDALLIPVPARCVHVC